MKDDHEHKMQWWREARFGLFIHWGLYSLLARGEWVMYQEQIPLKEYEKLAARFNPVQFNAQAWVRMAKNAGMKYIVITAKHHEGFSMFRTRVSDYNIVQATPFGRDPMLELADACKEAGIRLCFYYSHVREWRHPHAQSLEVGERGKIGNYGNFWDHRDEASKNLQRYIDEFDKPQLQELLTQYGPIGAIWFDTPSLIRPDQALELVEWVRQFQPDCIISGRVGGNGIADFESMGDCEVPSSAKAGFDWETAMTICGEAWGYNNATDNIYRSPKELIHQLVDVAGLGGNYLLNVGPTGEGLIPEEAQERLEAIGHWMLLNRESVHGTSASPFPKKPSWGNVTCKKNTLYLHLFKWLNELTLTGLHNPIISCKLLEDPERRIVWEQSLDAALGYPKLKLVIEGDAPNLVDSVVIIELEGSPLVDNVLIQEEADYMELLAAQATLHKTAPDSQLEITHQGVVRDWIHTEDWVSWQCLLTTPGVYAIELIVKTGFYPQWDYGHVLELSIGDQVCTGVFSDNGQPSGHYQELAISMGSVQIKTAHHYELTLKALELVRKQGQGLTLTAIRFKKV
ncbi:unnamed protein product [Aphanomyces euteiches]